MSSREATAAKSENPIARARAVRAEHARLHLQGRRIDLFKRHAVLFRNLRIFFPADELKVAQNELFDKRAFKVERL